MRLLYGGRNSLEVGFVATLMTMVLATLVGIVAGFFRGFVDGVLARLLDLIWAYPVVLLGIALGTSLALGGILGSYWAMRIFLARPSFDSSQIP